MPDKAASGLAEAMTRLPAEKLLYADSRIDAPDPKLVKSMLEMLQPDNLNVIRVAPSTDGEVALSAAGVEACALRT